MSRLEVKGKHVIVAIDASDFGAEVTIRVHTSHTIGEMIAVPAEVLPDLASALIMLAHKAKREQRALTDHVTALLRPE